MSKVLIGMLLGMAFAMYCNHKGNDADPIFPYRTQIWWDHTKCQKVQDKCHLTWEWK